MYVKNLIILKIKYNIWTDGARLKNDIFNIFKIEIDLALYALKESTNTYLNFWTVSQQIDVKKLLIDRKSPTSIAATAAFSSSSTNLNGNNRHYSTREIKFIVFYFGIRILITSIIWNHFVHKYHDLLMVFSNNPIKRVYFIYILSKFSLIYLN